MTQLHLPSLTSLAGLVSLAEVRSRKTTGPPPRTIMGALITQEAAVMEIPIPMAKFFFQKVVRDTLKMVPNGRF